MTADPANDTFGPRRWSRLKAFTLIALLGAGLIGLNSGRGYVAGLAATLPRTPDAATMPMSTEVVDRNGLLLRPFTTPDGIWRLPVTVGEVDHIGDARDLLRVDALLDLLDDALGADEVG